MVQHRLVEREISWWELVAQIVRVADGHNGETTMRPERLGWGSLAEPDSRGQKAASSGNIGGTSGSGSQSSACSSSTGGGDRREFDCTLGYRGQDLRAGSSSHNQIGIGGGSGNGTAVLAAETAADEATDSDGSDVSTATVAAP